MKRLTLCLLAACTLWSAAVHSQSYTFTTLAGLAGSSGTADGPGSDARFYHPQDVAVDSAGYIYVTAHNTIRKISPDGVVSTLAGQAVPGSYADGRGSDARFNFPTGIAVDGAGYIYVADTDNHSIRKISPDGVVSTLAGQAGQFDSPRGVAADGAGNVYVADFNGPTIHKITPDGVVRTLAGMAGSLGSADGSGSDARFSFPSGVTLDSTGNVYVADTWNHTIRLGRPVSVPPPSLRFSLVANRLILSWPLSATNAVVETSSTLSPGAVWTPLPNPVGILGDSFVLTNTLEGDAQFYRLRTP